MEPAIWTVARREARFNPRWGTNMKLASWGLGLLSVAALLFSAVDADAFSLCNPCSCHRHHCHHFCHHSCETHITCRPYNAFTPICYGNLYCDGCCPNPCALAGGCSPSWGGCIAGSGCGGFAGPYAGGFISGFGPVYAGPLQPGWGDSYPGMLPSVPTSLPVTPGTPGTQVPAAPTVPPVLNHTTQYGNPVPYYGVQPTNYYPGYYGYPANYYPYQAGYNAYMNWPVPNGYYTGQR